LVQKQTIEQKQKQKQTKEQNKIKRNTKNKKKNKNKKKKQNKNLSLTVNTLIPAFAKYSFKYNDVISLLTKSSLNPNVKSVP
jgi:hypothetical protein